MKHHVALGIKAGVCGFCLFMSQNSMAGVINWVDWQSATPGHVSGTGTSQGETIGIEYAGIWNFVQTGSGTDYFNPDTYSNNAVIDNRPPAAEMISITGGSNALTHTVTFSQAVVNPIMAIVSLGQPSITVTYEFIDETFNILSSGTGFWGGAEPDSLFQLTPSILTGIEGHGAIQFTGSYTEISWNVPTFENWHGFTFGFEMLASQQGGGEGGEDGGGDDGGGSNEGEGGGTSSGQAPVPGTLFLTAIGFLALQHIRRRPA